MENLEKLKSAIKDSENIVFFGGAGVSTASNIPDFRGSSGIFIKNKNKLKINVSPEEIVSHDFFFDYTNVFYKFYFENMIFENAKPNKAHEALAKLEELGKLKAVVTQNIDTLHEKAGSKNVLKLHGTVDKNHCLSCGKFYDLDYMLSYKEKLKDYTNKLNLKDNNSYMDENLYKNEFLPFVPICKSCLEKGKKSLVKPDVVLYGEGLDSDIIEESIERIAQSDVLIIGGTSLIVYPAASFINYYRGNKLILINKSNTGRDNMADIIIHDDIAKIMFEAVKEL